MTLRKLQAELTSLSLRHKNFTSFMKGVQESSWSKMSWVHQLSNAKFFNYKAKENKLVDHIASALKNLVLSIREIKEDTALIDLYVAIEILSVFDNEAYKMAIFYLERKLTFTSAKIIESLKVVKQSLKDKEKTQLDMAQRTISGSTSVIYYYCHRPRHVKVYCYNWLDTAEKKAYARKNLNVQRFTIRSNNKDKPDKDAIFREN